MMPDFGLLNPLKGGPLVLLLGAANQQNSLAFRPITSTSMIAQMKVAPQITYSRELAHPYPV